MSKLNPQNATAYVGPGVLRKGGKITKVPNGPLIKKKGPFKGSTLKSGGKIKKAQNGTSKKESEDTVEFKIGNETYVTKRPKDQGPKWVTNPMPKVSPNVKTKGSKDNKGLDSLIDRATRGYKTGGAIKKAQNGDTLTVKKPTWQRMTQAQRAAKKAELGPEGFKIYKDSISTDATNRRVKSTGLSAEQLAANDLKLKEKMAKKKDAVDEGSVKCGPNFSSTKCGISKAAAKESKSDFKKKKNGGPIKKAQTGGTYYASSKGRVGRLSGSKIGDDISAVQNESIDTTGYAKGKKDFTKTINRTFEKPTAQKVKRADVSKVISNLKKGATAKMDLRTLDQRKKSKMKDGGLIKRADGSMSKRGLWDNIRKNKGSGKKPTKAMLVQEKKIKAKSKK